MNAEEPTSPDLASLPLKKAGVVLHGFLKKPRIRKNGSEEMVKDQHALIAPYTQGRFFDTQLMDASVTNMLGQSEDLTKYYMLPKGSIDPGEDALDAAIRETREETGIDLRKLLGDTNIGRLRQGKTIEHWRSTGYPGVTVLRADPIPFEHMYYSRSSVPTRMALFNVELDGIEHLKPYLKNQTNRDHPSEGKKTEPQVRRSIGEMTADAMKYPPFATYLEWLRHGAIPPDQFTLGGPARDPRHKRMFQLLQGAHAGEFVTESPLQNQWFSQLEYRYAPQGQIGSRADWQQFCAALPPEEYDTLRTAFGLIKAYAKGRGIVGSDDALIKMDDKDSPLHYYQEGADLVSSERFVAHSLTMAAVNEDYRRASSGDCAAVEQAVQTRLRHDPAFAAANVDDEAQLRRHMQVERSQLAGIVAFVPVRSLTRGVKRFQDAMVQRFDPSIRAYGMPGEYELLTPLVQARESQHDQWQVRMEDAATNKPVGLGGLGA